MSTAMRVVITGGGTGGHIYPALAVADEIRRRRPDAEILYIGSENGMEAGIVPRAGYRFETVHISGLNRSSRWEALKALTTVPGAVLRAGHLLREFQPDVVLGAGGYVSYPVIQAAVKLKYKSYIHEQNALPGLANRRLANKVEGVFLTFPEALQYMKPADFRVTGFPVRREIGNIEPAAARSEFGLEQGRFTLLVFGGSQGARQINSAVLEYLRRRGAEMDMQILWACGVDNYEEVKAALPEELLSSGQSKVILHGFIHNMPAALCAADMALCRAGAGTISELALAGLPAILVPYPYAAENHQQKNAEAIASKGAALMVPDHELNGMKLDEILNRLQKERPVLELMSRRMHEEARPGALDEIVDILIAAGGKPAV